MVFASASYPWGSPCDTSFSPVLVGQQFKTFKGDWAAYQGVHICCSRFDLDTGCVSFFPSLASPQQLVVTPRSSVPLRLIPFGWVSPLLLLARVSRSVRLPLCSIIFSLPHPLQVLFSLSSPAGSLPGQRSFPATGYCASCRASFSYS